MEAATPLRSPSVHVMGDRLSLHGVVVSDATAVRLVRDREGAGEDPVKAVVDALVIGARVLDREQAGAHAEFVKAEFDKVSREVETSFTRRATEVTDRLALQLETVFGPESGHLSRALDRHFSDGSSSAVQHRVRELVSDVMARSREDLLRQFSAADGHNPLAEFKTHTIAAVHEAGRRQSGEARALQERMAGLERELQGLREERRRLEEVAQERERGTAKGRTFEESVAEAIDAIAAAQGDDCDAVGDLRAGTGKTGDVLVGIEACRGPARGRIVFEAKTGRLSKPKALQELDDAKAQRDADFAVLVVPAEDKVPAKTRPLREYNGDKLIVVFDPEEGDAIGLEVGYALARARVLMARGGVDDVDPGAVRDVVERALGAMEDVRRIKQQLTGAATSIDQARAILEAMAERVRDHLREVDALVVPAQTTLPGAI